MTFKFICILFNFNCNFATIKLQTDISSNINSKIGWHFHPMLPVLFKIKTSWKKRREREGEERERERERENK
jgi:hypothetical protein